MVVAQINPIKLVHEQHLIHNSLLPYTSVICRVVGEFVPVSDHLVIVVTQRAKADMYALKSQQNAILHEYCR